MLKRDINCGNLGVSIVQFGWSTNDTNTFVLDALMDNTIQPGMKNMAYMHIKIVLNFN